MSQKQPLFAHEIRFERLPGTSDAVITFEAAGGETVAVDLSPHAQTHLLAALVSSAKARIADGQLVLARPPIQATGFQSFVLADNMAGLEIQVHESAAIHVAFDALAFEQLAEAVRRLSTPGTAASANGPA
ncbi:MAG: hypothetical protein ACXWC2_18990 [Ramlibacter sp.]